MNLVRAFVCAVLLVGTVGAQQSAPVIEPEKDHVVFYLDARNGKLIPLEQQKITVQAKSKTPGAGSTGFFEGPKSPVRFKAGQPLQFVVRMDVEGMDPTNLIEMDALLPSKKTRKVVPPKKGELINERSESSVGATLSIDWSKYGEHSVKFSPTENLRPGEYVITMTGYPTGYLFGVD